MARSDKGIQKYTDRELIERHSCPEPNSGCWLWLGHVNGSSYGRLGRGRCERQVHRLSYRAYIAPIPSGMNVLHKCDVPSCVNPDHLFLGSLSDNMQDCLRKGRYVALRGEASIRAKLTYGAVEKIRQSHATVTELAKRFGVSRRAIQFVKDGKTWSR